MKKPRPTQAIGRKRRAAGWALLILGTLIAAVWAASFFWGVRWAGSRGGVGMAYGQAYVAMYGRLDAPYGQIRMLGLDSFQGTSVYTINGPVQLSWRTKGKDAFDAYKSRSKEAVRWDMRLLESISIPPLVRAWYCVLWPVPLLLWTAAALLLYLGIRAQWRALDGYCVKCGYWLGGLGSNTPCPECGKRADIA